MATNGGFVRLDRDGGVAWVTLDRPPLNLIVPEMVEGIRATFDALRRDATGRAAEITLTGDPITAEQALAGGLVNRVAPPAGLRAVTAELVGRIVECAPTAVRLQKELIVRWRNTDQRTAVEYGINAFGQSFTTGEPREAMDAYLGKRKPRFAS